MDMYKYLCITDNVAHTVVVLGALLGSPPSCRPLSQSNCGCVAGVDRVGSEEPLLYTQ